MAHEDLVEKAKNAIDKVFGDKSVDRPTTRESLEELSSHIEAQLNTLDDDDEDNLEDDEYEDDEDEDDEDEG